MPAQFQAIEPMLGDYPALCCREFHASKMSICTRCLMVGCGPFPFSAIIFSLLRQAAASGRLPPRARFLGPDSRAAFLDMLEDLEFPLQHYSWCTCIDRDGRALESAAAVLRRLELHDCVSLHVGSAEVFDSYQDFDIVHIAAMVSGKEAALRRSAEMIRPGAQIILRIPGEQSLQSLLYEPLARSEIERLAAEAALRIVEVFEPSPGMDIVTGFIVLEKK